MRKLLLASVASLALLEGQALAADLALKGPVYAPASNWTGFYIGLQAGYGWSNSTVDLVSSGVQ